MQLSMTAAEQNLFASFLRSAKGYAEFGSGGSTYLASALVDGPVVTLDSSRDWLDQVAAACAKDPDRRQPRLVFVDIGPTGAWGAPADASCKSRWERYSLDLWEIEGTEDSDVVLVDGRFRVACFVESLLRCRPDTVVLFHDFGNRPHYHVAHEAGREIARAENLVAFVRRRDFTYGKARRMLAEYRNNPD
jgi:hypothetical protein